MSCGTPVLTSNAASLPEVVGDAAIMVDPMSVDSIYKGMKRLWDDKGLRLKLSEKGIERASKFSWEQTADRFSEIISRVAQK